MPEHEAPRSPIFGYPGETPKSVATDGTARESSRAVVSTPPISLPKGGGAIRGMGEKFAANPVTGTGSLSVPLGASPGRSGFGPQLSLSYDSGAGNGPFGFGWSLSVAAITRKTDKGIPRYSDAEESDVYILSGAEDLAPVLQEDGTRFKDETSAPGFVIHRYRPRIEGLFARIERWTNIANGEIHWRSITRDNVTTLYGKDRNSQISDAERVFSWSICQSYDDKGNAIVYEYAEENADNVDLAQANERNRTRTANRYVKRIKYGNRAPNREANTWQATDPAQLPNQTWMFEVVFDYGEGHYTEQSPDAQNQISARAQIDPAAGSKWLARQDPFSQYRAGFEIRTYRLCCRVLMFHHFPLELGLDDCLVRSTEFSYAESSSNTFIASVSQSGFVRQGDRYLKKSLPPLEFEYSQAPGPVQLAQQQVRDVDPESLENLPVGLDSRNYTWVDLDGEGSSGILTEQAGAWHYKRNLSANNLAAQFGPMELVASKPAITLTGGGQFLDLDGDGQIDVVQMEGAVRGFYERTEDTDWTPFKPFASWPGVDTLDPDLKFVDLTGDGYADILITEGEVLTWYPSLAQDGFGEAVRVDLPLDEEQGPRLVFADSTEAIFLADMSGDGLHDLVRVRNGEVCYWPNSGYGQFGAKVTMDGSPWFDSDDQFDDRRIRLADIDGSGTTDIIYLRRDGVRIYFNQSGNGWSEAAALPQFPALDDTSTVQALDLLGNGTACLVWSSPLPGNARGPMRYLPLMDEKPHLLTGVENNLGAETKVFYAPSTKFYLDDKRAGKPWVTRLPFPVHVVERVETYDCISRNRFVSRSTYHHGYFDGIEREFRGFGMVEQLDTEEFAALNAGQQLSPASNIDASSHVPPVLTRTWFHTGNYFGRDCVSNHYIGEYYREPGLTDAQARQQLLDDTVLPPGLTADEEREACRALKGAMLRQEVYALDGSDKQPYPYSVTEQNLTLQVLQPQGSNRYAVCFAHPRESIAYHCERIPADPRVTHSLTLAVDGFGNVLKTAGVAYGRRLPDPTLRSDDQAKQSEIHIVYSENDFTNAVDSADDYRTPLSYESRSFELTGLALSAGSNRFSFVDLLTAGATAAVLTFEQNPTAGMLQKRIIAHGRTLYRSDDLSIALPLGQLQSLALAHESYKLTFTPGLIAGVYGAKVTEAMFGAEGCYVHSEGDDQWWIPSGRALLSAGIADDAATELANARQHFFLARCFVDPFGQISTVDYDAYNLLATQSRDPLNNVVRADEHDYRVLQPRLIVDRNGNRTAASFDALGMSVGTAVMGKLNETPRHGDLLDGFVADLPDDAIASHLQNPLTDPQTILGHATTRLICDYFAYYRTRELPQPRPSAIYAMVRETHDAELAPGQQTKIQHIFSYSDGFGRAIQMKVQAEPGPEAGPNGRWVGSGWTIFNNKGKPIRQFEPFFTSTQAYETDVRIGVSPVLFYDPTGRTAAILHPNHTWQKVVFGPWRQESWDATDTALIADPKTDSDVAGYFRRLPDADYLPTWHSQRQAGALGPEEQAAAAKTAIHAGTPSVAHADSLGRTFLTIARNRYQRSNEPSPTEELFSTRVVFDIEGNQREVIDANDRVVMRFDYNTLGQQIHQTSMDAGERWALSNIAGNPLYAWDSREHRAHTVYDELQRPTASLLSENAGPEKTVGQSVYGESQTAPEAWNQRGKVVQARDQAGVAIAADYDFKGNLLASSRRLTADHKGTVDWSGAVALEPEVYASSSTFDALNRPTEQIRPDGSRIRHAFNEANLLERVEANLRGVAAVTPFVNNIDYDPKGRRTLIEYGNGVKTTYSYDPLTFRMMHLQTKRDPALFAGDCPQPPPNGWPGCSVQSLSYFYDPVGNITRIRDDSQQTIYFRNIRVEPTTDYIYDAVYRLIEATGREQLGQDRQAPAPASYNDVPRVHLLHPGDGAAMGTYIERYQYDPVGNFVQFIHRGSDPSNAGWTRSYNYAEASLLESGKVSNRLSDTEISGSQPLIENYAYDPHGSMTQMPHLPTMEWNFHDQLSATQRQAVNASDADGVLHQGERTYYVYDGAGQRARKVTERQNGTLMKERRYLGAFEVYREYDASGNAVTLERETLHMMDEKKRMALVETSTKGVTAPPTIRYQFGNHLGSASLELDDLAEIVSYEEYFPYGSTSYQEGRNGAEVSLKRYRYTGMERDEESGLNYHAARYYAPWLGRWASVDPEVSTLTHVSPFIYSSANPVVLFDDSGRAPKGTDELARQLDRLERYVRQFISVNSDTIQAYNEKTAARGTLEANVERVREFEQKVGALVSDLQAVESALKPNERAAITSLRERAEQLNGSLGGARTKIGEALNPPPKVTSLPRPTKPVDPNFFRGHQAAVVRNAKTTDLPTATARYVEGREPPKLLGPGSEEGAIAGKGLGTKALTVATVAIVALGEGSLKEKAETLTVGYGVGKGTEILATRVVGAELAGILSLPVAFVIGMCGDQAGACEAQARAEARQDLIDEINGRAWNIYLIESTKGYVPDLNFVYEMAIHEKYVALGLDKVEEARRRMVGPQDPNVCTSAPQGLDWNARRIDLNNYVPNTAPSMSAR
ncbi:MAG: SpvB/TcaC N-terminal domain-containing protein [Bryobacteraceae bacterium]